MFHVSQTTMPGARWLTKQGLSTHRQKKCLKRWSGALGLMIRQLASGSKAKLFRHSVLGLMAGQPLSVLGLRARQLAFAAKLSFFAIVSSVLAKVLQSYPQLVVRRLAIRPALVAKCSVKEHKRPPIAEPYGVPFDSTTARPGIPNGQSQQKQNHWEFVVPDAQAYPEFLAFGSWVLAFCGVQMCRGGLHGHHQGYRPPSQTHACFGSHACRPMGR